MWMASTNSTTIDVDVDYELFSGMSKTATITTAKKKANFTSALQVLFITIKKLLPSTCECYNYLVCVLLFSVLSFSLSPVLLI